MKEDLITFLASIVLGIMLALFVNFLSDRIQIRWVPMKTYIVKCWPIDSPIYIEVKAKTKEEAIKKVEGKPYKFEVVVDDEDVKEVKEPWQQ